MKRWNGLLGGLVAGAGLMFLLDPDRGARRRALLRDQARAARERARKALETTLEDARNRAAGTIVEAKQRWREEPVSDRVLAERVRARLGLVCSDVDALEVEAHEGRLVLRGKVAPAELARIVRTARWTRGVRMIDDRLELRDEPAEARTGGDR